MASPIMDKQRGQAVLIEVAGVLDLLAIPFFLMQGTALGAYRDGGFVPWERDIDFGVLIENLAPVADELSAVLESAGYSIRQIVEPFTVCRTVVAAKGGAKADIVGWTVWNDKRFTASPLDSFTVGPRPWALIHNRELMERYEAVEMFGHKFNVPSPIKTYLLAEYGDTWSQPIDSHNKRSMVYDFIRDNNLPPDFLERQIAK